ncbi:MAG: DUF4190 domain-containing protein [Phycisphaerales bacterium]
MDEHTNDQTQPAPAPAAPPTRPAVLCASCRYDISNQPVGGRCPECGTPIMQTGSPQLTQGKAIAAMVLGICSIPACLLYGIPGLVCGILAVVYAKKADVAIQLGQAPVTSRGFAKAGRICGWVGIALSCLYALLIFAYIAFMVLIMVGASAGGGGY